MKITPILILCCSIGSLGFPNGPPSSACDDMMPDHGVPPNVGEPPFRVSTFHNTYYKGERISVTLETVTGIDFMGFFLQARWTNSSRGIGRFFIGQETNIRHLTCGAGYNNALSHHQRLQKTNITFSWSNIEGYDVYFTATIVRNKNESWTNIQSELIKEVEPPSTMEPTVTQAPTSRGSSPSLPQYGFIGLVVMGSFVEAIL